MQSDQTKDHYNQVIKLYEDVIKADLISIDRDTYDFLIYSLSNFAKQSPKDADLYCKIGTLYQKLGAYDAAIKYFEKSIHIDPHCSTYYDQLGHALFEIKKFDWAQKAFHQAKANFYNQLGHIYVKIDKCADALDMFEKSVYYNPVNSDQKDFYLNIKNHRKAIYSLERAVHYNPEHVATISNIRLYNYIGNLYLKKGDYQEASENFMKALTLEHQKPCFLKSIRESIISGLKKTIEQKTDHFKIYTALKKNYFRLKEYNQLKEILNQLIQLHPLNDLYHYELGTIYGITSQNKKALLSINKAIEMVDQSPHKDPQSIKAKYYNKLGEIYFKMDQFQDALSQFDHAIKLLMPVGNSINHDSLLAKIYYNMGQSHLKMTHYSEAINLFKCAIRFSRKKTYLKTLISACVENDQYDTILLTFKNQPYIEYELFEYMVTKIQEKKSEKE